ncbi:MAG: VPLPA-CTERM sorting domain-containing protein [Pseudotabrizicola sp.]|uniref:VPLPA-CTERM sorting domain-containing protein n=1 Tax=Pseudotabrizicola sp. TaxID=2939647 RepID=UPI002720C1BB|nr:VPLPA-CTERM sorting domain-containing protein [Pseudotabrizicola sp.]MDO9638735.1 VPLPA-CTERM sorting domain-containing protein [Pseudotabrizicola sp.]
MIRLTALSTTALVLLALPQAGFAAPCTFGLDPLAPTITCSAPDSNPVSASQSNLAIAVTPTGSVTSTNRSTSPFSVSGTDVSIVNQGTIANTDTRNNTNAIEATGTGLTIENSGTISSGDRAIHALIGFGGGLVVTNTADGVIESRRQTIRTEDNAPGSVVTNYGTISSLEGRALQLRGQGTTVTNYGTMTGGEEVIEARDDFTLTNYGTIILRDGIYDEDGVQFASGTVNNHGTIQGSDDGIDIDEGFIHNHATGRIISTGTTGHGIDIDPVFDNGRDAIRPSGTVTIVNEGYIEGPAAIGSDEAAANSVHVTNSGTLVGRDGYAIKFAPVQGDSFVSLTGNSVVTGGILFGAGNDVLEIRSLTSGLLFDGLADGGAGQNTLRFSDYLLGDLATFKVLDGIVSFGLNTVAGQVFAQVTNFDNWIFGNGQSFATAELAGTFAPVPVPVPASLPLLLGALAGLTALRRRKR